MWLKRFQDGWALIFPLPGEHGIERSRHSIDGAEVDVGPSPEMQNMWWKMCPFAHITWYGRVVHSDRPLCSQKNLGALATASDRLAQQQLRMAVVVSLTGRGAFFR
jgi:hypothetical protein